MAVVVVLDRKARATRVLHALGPGVEAVREIVGIELLVVVLIEVLIKAVLDLQQVFAGC
jgi:hypothetical protein